jgi:hypothetical protein
MSFISSVIITIVCGLVAGLCYDPGRNWPWCGFFLGIAVFAAVNAFIHGEKNFEK